MAGIVSAAILILAVSPAEARLQNKRSFTLAERQLLLIESMTNSVLLAALGIDASPSMNSIHWSRDRFDRMQKDLRKGDPHLGLPATTEPQVLEPLDRADLQWQRYDAIFAEIVKARRASKVQIDALTASHAGTIKALDEVVAAYEKFIYGGQHHSILSGAISGTGKLRANTQLLLRNLMMVAYHNYAKPERDQLARATVDFDQTINGLIHGNPQRHLLPAATAEIGGELTKVLLMWQKIRPILESAAAGQAVTKDQIANVAKAASDMAVPLTITLIMYLSV